MSGLYWPYISRSNLANCKFASIQWKRLQQSTVYFSSEYSRSLNPMALSKTKVSYSLNQPKMKEKKSFREGESETELAVPPGVSRTEKKDW